MVSVERISLARELLGRAAACDGSKEDERLQRNLLIAAAFREVLTQEPIVVGGTAEDFWTADAYHETALDLVTWSLTSREKDLLNELGLTREGRHWVHAASGVPVEIPESRLRGDLARVHREPTHPGVASIISSEDLYLDRVRQSTMSPDDEMLPTYKSSVAIAAANYDRMDWRYVDQAIRDEQEVSRDLMRGIDKRARRAVRDRLSGSRRKLKRKLK